MRWKIFCVFKESSHQFARLDKLYMVVLGWWNDEFRDHFSCTSLICKHLMFSERYISLGRRVWLTWTNSFVALDRFIDLGMMFCLHSPLLEIIVFSLQMYLGSSALGQRGIWVLEAFSVNTHWTNITTYFVIQNCV